MKFTVSFVLASQALASYYAAPAAPAAADNGAIIFGSDGTTDGAIGTVGTAPTAPNAPAAGTNGTVTGTAQKPTATTGTTGTGNTGNTGKAPTAPGNNKAPTVTSVAGAVETFDCTEGEFSSQVAAGIITLTSAAPAATANPAAPSTPPVISSASTGAFGLTVLSGLALFL